MRYVYGETVLIENFIINLLILIITSKLSRSDIKWKRILLGALIGSIFAVLQFNYKTINHLSFKIILSMIILILSYYPINFRGFLDRLIIFYAITLLFGGCVLLLLIFTDLSGNMTLSVYGVKSTTVVLGIAVGVVSILKIRDIILEVKLKSSQLLDLCISSGSKKLTAKGFVDTGCNVVDVLTGKPTLLIEFDAVRQLLPTELVNYIEAYDGSLDENIDKKISDISILKKVRFTPYRTVEDNCEKYLLCYRFESIAFYDEKNVRVLNNIYSGICKYSLSNYNEFQALINPKLLYM